MLSHLRKVSYAPSQSMGGRDQLTICAVYPDYLPSVIPFVVYLKQTLLFLYRQTILFFRIHISIFSWLVLLPLMGLSSLRTTLPLSDFV